MKKYLSLVLILFFYASCTTDSQKDSKDADTQEAEGLAVPRTDHLTLHSEKLGTVEVDVWLPKGYSPKKKYAVLYMNDGQFVLDPSKNTVTGQEWEADETVSDLMERNLIMPTIVVAVYSPLAERYTRYFPKAVYLGYSEELQEGLMEEQVRRGIDKYPITSDEYLTFLVNQLKIKIDHTYSTYQDKEHTFIAGSSMGGLISLYALCEYPAVFGGAACLSTHWSVLKETTETAYADGFVDYLSKRINYLQGHKVYFDYGTKGIDQFYQYGQLRIDSVFRANGFTPDNFLTLKFEGHDHDIKSWRDRLDVPLKFLLKPQGNELEP